MHYAARVVPGKGRGKKLGSPTLNLEIPENFSYTHGIYAGWVLIGEKKYRAAIHFGPIPVFNENEPTLEAHLIDEALAETPHEIEIELVSYLRAVQNFESPDALKEQIARDIETAKTKLSAF